MAMLFCPRNNTSGDILEPIPDEGRSLARSPLTICDGNKGILSMTTASVWIGDTKFVGYGIAIDWIAKSELTSCLAAGNLFTGKSVDSRTAYGRVGGWIEG